MTRSLEDLITGVLECAVALPNNEEARDDVAQSLVAIGIVQPSFFLSAIHGFLMQHTKLSEQNRVFILTCIDRILEHGDILKGIDEQQLLLLINLVTQEMILAKDSEEDCSLAASNVLVTIAKKRKLVEYVMDALLQKFPPGLSNPPHRYIFVTLAMISEHNCAGFVPYLVDVLSRSIPLLPYVKNDAHKLVWARAFYAFCETLKEYATSYPLPKTKTSNGDITMEPESESSIIECDYEVVSIDDEFIKTYADQLESAYEVICGWLSSREQKVRSAAANCVGELCLMISKKRINDDLRKLVPLLLTVHRKSNVDQHLITQGICHFLEGTCKNESCPLEPYLEEILNTLFPFVCVTTEQSVVSSASMRNQNEALRCFHVAASRFADKIVYYLLHKMQNVQDSCKLGAINVLRHLINSSGPYMEDKYSLVILGLKPILQTGNDNNLHIRVRKAICQLCVALADHGYVRIEGGEQVILFLINNLIIQEDSGKKSPSNSPDRENDTPKQLRLQCGQALQTIAKTCDSACKLLWPLLFEYICAESYTSALVDIFKCLRILVERQNSGNKPVDYDTGFDNPNVAGPQQVFARLLTCLGGAPMNAEMFVKAYEALRLIRAIAIWFHKSIKEVINERFEQLEASINELSPLHSPGSTKRRDHGTIELRSTRLAQWRERVFDFIFDCVSSVSDGEWRCSLAAAMGKQLSLYNGMPNEKAFLMQCLGCVLAKIANKTFVVDHLVLMFRSAVHFVVAERVGCAQGVGFCATTHTDLVLTELENIAKWENTRRSSGFFGFIKDAMPYKHYTNADMVSLRATIMLSCGYALLNCPVDVVTQRLEQSVFVFLRNYLENSRQDTVVREALLETLYLIGVTVHPAHLNVDYRLSMRDEMLGFVKEYVRAEQSEVLSSSIRQLGSKAVAALVKLDPPIGEAETWDIGSVLTTCTFPLCRERGGLKTVPSNNELTDKPIEKEKPILFGDLYEPHFSVAWQNTSFIFRHMYSFPHVSFVLWPSEFSPVACSSYSGTRVNSRKKNLMHLQIDNDGSSTMMEATLLQYFKAIEQMVKKNATVGVVTQLLKLFQPYYASTADHERARAVDASILVLKTYFECATDFVLGVASDFGPMSSLLARLVPRITDTLCSIRYAALRVVHWTFRLAFIFRGFARETADANLFDPDLFIRKYLGEEGRLDGQSSRRAVQAMAAVIDARLPQSQMQMYLSGLFDMLNDRQSQVSSAAAQLLTYALTQRGEALSTEAEILVVTIMAKLPEVHSCLQTYTDLLAAFIAFASRQLFLCIDVLLLQMLPFSEHATDAWRTLAHEHSLFPQVADYLLELMITSCGVAGELPFEVFDAGGGSSMKIVKPNVCALIAASTELIKAGEPEDEFVKRIPNLLATLLILLSGVVDTQYPLMQRDSKDGSKRPLIITPELRRLSVSPATLVTDALSTLLTRTHDEVIIEQMNSHRAWSDCCDPVHFTTAILVLIRSISQYRTEWIEPLLVHLTSRNFAASDAFRLASVAVFSSLVKKYAEESTVDDTRTLDLLVDLLMKSLEDKNLRIRKLSVRGFGDLAVCSSENLKNYSERAIQAAMHGLDDSGDRRDEVAMEALNALNKLASRVGDAHLKSILPSVLLKLRPCFEKESSALRAVSFSLFGELGSRIGNCDTFKEQLLANVVSMLLHLNDEENYVRQMCARCISQVGTLLNSDALDALIAQGFREGDECVDYLRFLKDFCVILAFSFSDRINYFALNCNNYFKSSSSQIRANAAHMTGFLLGELTPELRSTVSKELIFSGLLLLLKDHDLNVRLATARAISNLHDFS